MVEKCKADAKPWSLVQNVLIGDCTKTCLSKFARFRPCKVFRAEGPILLGWMDSSNAGGPVDPA
jgi:hypothetical protein